MAQSKNVHGHENLVPVCQELIPTDDEIPCVQFSKPVSTGGMQSLPDFDDLDKTISLTRLIECAYESAKEQKAVLYKSEFAKQVWVTFI